MQFKFTDPASDFSNGLLVLKAYHENLLERGEQLLKLVDEIDKQGINEALAYQCMENFWHYQHANLLHHQDEEQGLFPLMLGKSALVDGMMERLMLDHEEIEKAWDKLATYLSQPEKITNTGLLKHLATEFEQIQREHLIREDEDFSPRVQESLTEQELQQMGDTMKALRHKNS